MPQNPDMLAAYSAHSVNEKIKHRLRVRLTDILFRHLRNEDDGTSDDELICRVLERYQQSRREYLVDPNE
jgi:hypothetical protein